MVTVKQLIEALQEYNPEAEVNVVAHNTVYDFSLSYSGEEGVNKHSADEVSFYVDQLNSQDESYRRVSPIAWW